MSFPCKKPRYDTSSLPLTAPSFPSPPVAPPSLPPPPIASTSSDEATFLLNCQMIIRADQQNHNNQQHHDHQYHQQLPVHEQQRVQEHEQQQPEDSDSDRTIIISIPPIDTVPAPVPTPAPVIECSSDDDQPLAYLAATTAVQRGDIPRNRSRVRGVRTRARLRAAERVTNTRRRQPLSLPVHDDRDADVIVIGDDGATPQPIKLPQDDCVIVGTIQLPETPPRVRYAPIYEDLPGPYVQYSSDEETEPEDTGSDSSWSPGRITNALINSIRNGALQYGHSGNNELRRLVSFPTLEGLNSAERLFDNPFDLSEPMEVPYVPLDTPLPLTNEEPIDLSDLSGPAENPLPSTTKPGANGPNRCPVCWDSYEKKPPGSTFCGHIFCIPCLKEVMRDRMSRNCPTCRQRLTGKGFHPIYLS